jgi:hypothetical protein
VKQDFKAELTVNNKPIELNPFVEEFLARTVVGAVSSLKGVDHVANLDLRMKERDVSLAVDGHEVPLSPFPNQIVASTLVGLLSALKGVEDIESLNIKVAAE